MGLPIFSLNGCAHEIICDPDAVVGVLEEHGTVRLAVNRPVVAGVYERPGLLLLVRLRPDKIHNIRMVHVEDDHLRSPPGPPAGLDDTSESVEALHEGHRATGLASGGEVFF